jgi:hypothetical protein
LDSDSEKRTEDMKITSRHVLLAVVASLSAGLLGAGASEQGGRGGGVGAASDGRAELVVNGDFSRHEGKVLEGYELTGAAAYGTMGSPLWDNAGRGVSLNSAAGERAGSVSQMVSGIDAAAHRWYRFAFRGMPETGFAVASDQDLYFRIEYFDAAGKSFDHLAKAIYPMVEQARRDLSANGVRRQNGAAAWRTYEFPLRIPFPEVTRAKVTVGFAHGTGRDLGGASGGPSFEVTDFSFAPTEAPVSDEPKAPAMRTEDAPPAGVMVPLGGRWFYQSVSGEAAPATFDASNGGRLWYHDAVWQAPFAENMNAVLRAGWKDKEGNIAKVDTPVPNALTVSFQSGSLVMHTADLPNHPTGRFPEVGVARGNPSYITEQELTYYIPTEPKENPRHTVTDATNSNRALNMGAIGVAINGVVFFNPFDMGNTDATDMMDRCCGHPQQQGTYHYHKYPICVNSPWDDAGTGHSGLIGFAFDGYPLYGPYEEKGVLARDESGSRALNGFNMHYDKERGWHYHVTPGKFPYLIGGYWGTVDARDVRRGPPGGGPGGGGPGGPGGGRGPGGGGPGGGPGGGGPGGPPGN